MKGDDGKESTKQLAPATVAKRVHVARAIFKRAVRWGLIPASPFADLRAGVTSQPRSGVLRVRRIRPGDPGGLPR